MCKSLRVQRTLKSTVIKQNEFGLYFRLLGFLPLVLGLIMLCYLIGFLGVGIQNYLIFFVMFIEQIKHRKKLTIDKAYDSCLKCC